MNSDEVRGGSVREEAEEKEKEGHGRCRSKEGGGGPSCPFST